MIIDLVTKQEAAIQIYIYVMVAKIVDGDVDAVLISNENTDEHYLLKWCGNPYIFLESLVNTLFLNF